MKLSMSVLVFFVLLITPVFATIVLDPLPGQTYNFGDTVLVSGEVSVAQSQKGYFSLYLACQAANASSENSQQLFLKLYDLDASVPRTFSELVSLSSDAAGSCFIHAKLMDLNSVEKESVKSTAFQLTRNLDGLFDVVQRELQLGTKLTIHGSIKKLSGQPVTGVAKLTFTQGSTIVLVESVEVDNGVLDFVKDMNSMPPGVYTVSVHVSDSYGNAYLFEDTLSLTLVSDLFVTLHVDKGLYSPRDTVTFVGTARGKVAGTLPALDVVLTVDGETFSNSLSGNKNDFTFTYALPPTITSGQHTASVIVKDVHGNEGTKETTFNVRAVPTKYDLVLSETFYNPQGILMFTPELYDQADAHMDGTVVVTLTGPDERLYLEKTVRTGTQETFTFPSFALPGEWELRLEGYGLTYSTDLLVNEFHSLAFSLDKQQLYVTNDGNVVYNKELVIRANDKEVVQQLNLALNETLVFDLYNLFDDGTYTLMFPDHNKQFDNVVVVDSRSLLKRFGDGVGDITGGVVKGVTGSSGNGWLWFVLLLFVAVGSIVFVKVRKSDGKSSSDISSERYSLEQRQRDYNDGVKKREELEKMPPPRKQRYHFGKANEHDVEEFRKRMTHVVQEQEQKDRKYFGDKSSEGFRNMFQ